MCARARCVPRQADHRKDMEDLSQIVPSSRMTLASYIFLLGSVFTAPRLPCCSAAAGNSEESFTKVFSCLLSPPGFSLWGRVQCSSTRWSGLRKGPSSLPRSPWEPWETPLLISYKTFGKFEAQSDSNVDVVFKPFITTVKACPLPDSYLPFLHGFCLHDHDHDHDH